MIEVTRHIDPMVKRRYLRGQCFALAKVMAKASGLPVWGGFDDRGDPHHAFVYDAETGLGYDIRGALSLDTIMAGSAAETGTTGPLSEELILSHIGSYDPADLRQARKDVARFMTITKTTRAPDAGPSP